MVVSLPSAAPGILLQDLNAMERISVVMPLTSQLQLLKEPAHPRESVQLQYQYEALDIIPLFENVLVKLIDPASGTGNVQLHVSDGGGKVLADASFMYGCVWSLLNKTVAWKKDGLMEIYAGKNGRFFLADIYLRGMLRQQPENCIAAYFETVFPVWQCLMLAMQAQLSFCMQPGKDAYLQLKCLLA